MTKPGYYQIRLTKENQAHIRTICDRLGLDPDDWGAYAKAINFALRLVALELMKDGE